MKHKTLAASVIAADVVGNKDVKARYDDAVLSVCANTRSPHALVKVRALLEHNELYLPEYKELIDEAQYKLGNCMWTDGKNKMDVRKGFGTIGVQAYSMFELEKQGWHPA